MGREVSGASSSCRQSCARGCGATRSPGRSQRGSTAPLQHNPIRMSVRRWRPTSGPASIGVSRQYKKLSATKEPSPGRGPKVGRCRSNKQSTSRWTLRCSRRRMRMVGLASRAANDRFIKVPTSASGRKQTPNFNAQFSRYSCLLLTRSADSAPVRERFGGAPRA